MPKTAKYDEDLRFAPAKESDSRDELLKRADLLARAVVKGGAPRREEPAEASPQ